MSSADDESGEIAELLETLWVLRDYLAEMTLIGGWVPELYRRYGDAGPWRSRLSRTREADILVPLAVPRGGRDSIADVLRSAGFQPLQGERIAAVWLQDPGRGGKLEFLTGRRAPVMRQARALPIEGQPGLGALALPEDLNILERHRTTLRVAWNHGGHARELIISVPLLGAYVINKAVASRRRPSGHARVGEKRPKDLLYIRDVMAAGPGIVAQVERDLRALRESDAEAGILLETSQQVLQAVSDSDLHSAAAMLAERDRVSLEVGRLDVLGHVGDLAALIEETLG